MIAEEGWDGTEHSWKPVGQSCGHVHLKPIWGTNVSLAAPYWQCATSHHLGNARLLPYNLATAGRELMSTASQPTVSEMPAPPTGTKWWCHSSNQEATMWRPEEEEAAGLDVTPKEQTPLKAERGEAPGKAPQGEPLGSLQERLLNSSKQLGRHISRCTTAWTMTMKGSHNFSHTFKEMVHLHWPHRLWCPWGPGDMDWPKGPPGHSPHGKKFPKGHPFLMGGASHQITQDYGPKGESIPPRPWDGEVVYPSANGVAKRNRMKAQW